jgi:hypothetical protein
MSYQFLSGAIMMAFVVSAVFFYKFWKRSGERLFGMFATSFLILAIERFVLASIGSTNEPKPIIYLLRLCAFILILLAIVDKNRKSND